MIHKQSTVILLFLLPSYANITIIHFLFTSLTASLLGGFSLMNELIHHGNVTFLMIVELFSFGIVHACVNRKDHKTKWFVSFDALRMSTHLARTIFFHKKSWTSKKRCPCFHSTPIILAKLHHLKYCPSTSSTSDHFSNVSSLELFTVTRLLYTRRESSTKIKSSGLKKKRERSFFFFIYEASLFSTSCFK